MAKISNLDFYAILGVHPNAEDIVIRAAFKALAQRYHPDRFSGSKDEAHRRMADLTNAYETLADPARRRKYDRRRGLTARRATFYFKNPARERQPHFGALAARAAARKAQHYRTAVYVLMVVVVILSGFNVHQHAAQIKELFAWNRSASSVAVATPAGVATAPDAADGSSAPPTSTTANVRILPIGQGSTRPIGSSALEAQAPAPQAPDPATATPTTVAPAPVAPAPAVPAPAVANATKAPARAAAVEPLKATPVPSASPAVEPPKAIVAAPSASSAAPAADPAHKDAKRPASKPVVAKAAEPDRPAVPRPAADGERCSPELIALGLCNRNSTAKGQ